MAMRVRGWKEEERVPEAEVEELGGQVLGGSSVRGMLPTSRDGQEGRDQGAL